MVQRSILALPLAVALLGATAPGATARGGETVLLDFALPTCGPCQQMVPIVRSLEEAGYPVRTIDAAHEPDLAARFGVTQVPCFVMLVEGREVDRVVGPTSRDRLEQMLRQAARPISGPPRDLDDRLVRGQSPDPSRPSDPWTAVDARSALPETTAIANSTDVPRSSLQPLPADADDSAPADLLGASVRLRVDDPTGHSYGTGTIIDARSGEALVITCGHLFRDSNGKGAVVVERFAATPDGTRVAEKMIGEVISYNLDRDVGLVSVRPKGPVPIARVAPADALVDRGDRVTSVGCDHGKGPTAIATRVSAINRYQGPPNIEAGGAPVEGRSGGGLFNARRELVGVCFAADYEGNEGLYAAVESIHDELDRLGLSDVYRSPAEPLRLAAATRRDDSEDDLAASLPTAGPPIVRGQEPLADAPDVTPVGTAFSSGPSDDSRSRPSAELSPVEQAALEEIMSRAATSEVICIIRPHEPGGQSEVITLHGVSQEFIRALADRPDAQRTALSR